MTEGEGYATAAGMQALSDVAQTVATANINRKTREWNEMMSDKAYERQIEQRDYANWYNSPVQQMERFRNAGLNPNLIYGQGNSGNTNFIPKWERPDAAFGAHVPFQNIASTLGQYMTLKQQKQNIDLVNEDIVNKKIQNNILDLTQQDQIDYAHQRLQRMYESTNSEVYKQSLSESMTRLNNLKATVENIRKEWLEEGMSENDNMFFRLAFQQWKKLRNLSFEETSGRIENFLGVPSNEEMREINRKYQDDYLDDINY